MDVVLVRILELAECLTGLVIKLYEEDRTVDSIVKHAVLFHATHPGEISFPEMPLHFGQLDLRMVRPEATDMNFNHTKEEIVLGVR